MSPVYFLLMLFFLNVVILLTRQVNRARLLFVVNLAGMLAACAFALLDLLDGWTWQSNLLSQSTLAKYFVFIITLYFVTTLALVICERRHLNPVYYVGMLGQAVIALALVGAESLLLVWILIPLWFWQSYWFYSFNPIGQQEKIPSTYLLHIILVALATGLVVVGVGSTFNTFSLSSLDLSTLVTKNDSKLQVWGGFWFLLFLTVALMQLLSIFATQRKLATGALWSTLLHNYYLTALVGPLFLFRWVVEGAFYRDKLSQTLMSPFANVGYFLTGYVLLMGLFALWRIAKEGVFALRLGAWLQLGLLWPFMALATADEHTLKIALVLPLIFALGLSLLILLVRHREGLSSQSLMELLSPHLTNTRESLVLTLILLALLGPGISFIHVDLVSSMFNSLRQPARLSFAGYTFSPEQLIVGPFFVLSGVIFWTQTLTLMRRRRDDKVDPIPSGGMAPWVYIWVLSLIFVGIYPRPLYKYLDHLLKAIVI